MTVELYLLDKLKARIQLARQVDLAQHKLKKENHEKKWLREAAEAMEIEIDSDMNLRCGPFYMDHEVASNFEIRVGGCSDDDDNGHRDQDLPSKKQRKVASAKTAALKAELKELLAQPLIARGVSTRYITSGSLSIVDDMVLGQRAYEVLCRWTCELTLAQSTRRCSDSLRVPQGRTRCRRQKRSLRWPRRSPRNGLALAPDFYYEDCIDGVNRDGRSS